MTVIEIWDLIAARRNKLIEALWPDATDRPEHISDLTLDELISEACERLETNRYYLERKTT